MKTKLGHLFIAFVVSVAAVSHVFAANSGTPPFFQEVFSFSLQDYWCENHLSVADVDGDGRQDIVLMATSLSETSGPPWHYRSRAILLHAEADGSFTDSTITNFVGRYGYGAVTADLNNDAAPDLILREQSATHVLLNDGHGAFHEVWTGQPGYYNLAAVDVNHDGFLDIVSGTQTGSGGLIELFTNDGTGTSFEKTWQSRLYGSGYDSISTVLSVNLNNDGELDIAAREIYSGLLVTLRGTHSGDSFVEQNVMALGDRTFALAGGRVNADAVTDLAAYVGWGTVRVFVNRGNGSMADYWQSPDLGQPAFNLVMADFDQDGFDDIFVGTFRDGGLRIYRNNPGVGFDLWWQGSIPGDGYTGSVADLNGDGYPDLIVGERDRIRIFVNRIGIPLFAGNATVTEGNAGITSALFTVSLLTNHSAVVSVDFATVDGSATAGIDYTATNGTLIFNPGETSKTIAVPVLGDVLRETNETFFLRFSNPANVSLTQTQATGIIFEDDTPPIIVTQPLSQSVYLDRTITFAVSASGSAPLTYQWRRNGTAINGATNASLVIADAQFSDAGSYNVLVTNDLGFTISSDALLTVLERPDFFTEWFTDDDNDLAFSSITFTPDGSTGFYAACWEVAVQFPTDPAGGTFVPLGDDDFAQITLSESNTVAIYSQRTNVLFIGSNGYLTMDYGDGEYDESLGHHFNLPRVSALFDDLNPGDGGWVSWRELSNRVAISYENVPERWKGGSNSFQIEMFFDGKIRLTYLALSAQNGLAGLSAGQREPVEFLESNLSAYDSCVMGPAIFVQQPANIYLANGGSRDFGSVTLGRNNSLTFTIKNFGTADLDGLSITVDGPDAAMFSVITNPAMLVAPGGSTTFTVRFSPTSAGLRTGALHIASNDAEQNPFDVFLNGIGLTPVPEIAVEQPQGVDLTDGGNRDFGAVTVGSESRLTFTVKNLGTANLTGLSITPSGPDAAMFAITSFPAAPVAPGSSTTFTVRFAPTSLGAKSATLRILSNDADENAFGILLTGTCPLATQVWAQHGQDSVVAAVAVDASGNVVVIRTTNNYRGDAGNSDFYTAKYAGVDGALLWEKRYNDPANGNDGARAVAVDGSGNVVVTGYSGYDYYTVKYAAADGALLWESRYNGPANDYDIAMAVAVDGNGSVIVTGVSPNNRNRDFYTAKYAAATGSLLWEKRYDSGSDDQVAAMALDSSGNVAVTGQSYNGVDYDYYTAKYAAANGKLLWEQRYNAPAVPAPRVGQDVPSAVAIDGDGNVVVTGYSSNPHNDDWYTAKYAATNGALLWEKRYNGPTSRDDHARAIAVDRSGNVVVTGYSQSGSPTGVSYDFYTAKYAAADGTLLWEKRHTGGEAFAVAVDTSGNVVVTGFSAESGFGSGYYTAKYGALDGALLWEMRYGGGAYDIAWSLALGPNGMVAVTGGSAGFYSTVVYRDSLSPVSNLLPLSIEKLSAAVRVRFFGTPGHSYKVQRAPALTSPWITIATPTVATTGLVEYIDTNAPPGSAFYRTATVP